MEDVKWYKCHMCGRVVPVEWPGGDKNCPHCGCAMNRL